MNEIVENLGDLLTNDQKVKQPVFYLVDEQKNKSLALDFIKPNARVRILEPPVEDEYYGRIGDLFLENNYENSPINELRLNFNHIVTYDPDNGIMNGVDYTTNSISGYTEDEYFACNVKNKIRQINDKKIWECFCNDDPKYNGNVINLPTGTTTLLQPSSILRSAAKN